MVNPKEKIGFMLGRFSPIAKGMIQAFPHETWRNEFKLAKEHGFRFMEWVVEQVRLDENPLLSAQGRLEIETLKNENGIAITSVTCDAFIQEPFYKARGARKTQLFEDFKNIVEASCGLGMSRIVVPLVDKGSLENAQEKEELFRGMDLVLPLLKDGNAIIVFESDYGPSALKDFIGRFDTKYFGINYDIGNSASMGYDHREELALYGDRIHSVHIKDRKLNGPTVPLGEGDADILGVLRALKTAGYNGAYILQTARALDGGHATALCRYRDMVVGWLNEIEDGAYGRKNKVGADKRD